MKTEPKIEPKVLGITDWQTMVYPDGTMTAMFYVEEVGATDSYVLLDTHQFPS